MRRIVAHVLTVLLVTGACLLAGRPAVLAAPRAGNVTIHGVVTDTAGNPIPGAYVRIGAVSARADRAGHYHATGWITGQTLAFIWAPGYCEEQVLLTFPTGSQHIGALLLNFAGRTGLSGAFINPAAGARLAGLPVELREGASRAHLMGVASVPLESRVFVTLPDGHVRSYRLQVQGTAFRATVPFRGKGAYRVEINATSGMAVFNVLVFRGVAPYFPAEPVFPPDPPHLESRKTRAFVLTLVNQMRAGEQARPLKMEKSILEAAVAHTREMAHLGYFPVHPHLGADGSTPLERLRRLDPHVRVAGEVVGEAPTIDLILLGLLDSPGHRAILLGRWRWAGVAVIPVPGGMLLTIDFAR